MKGAFLPFKLIVDPKYTKRRWFYSPFKGEKGRLPSRKAHWNFIQSSIHMVVESIWNSKRKVAHTIEEN